MITSDGSGVSSYESYTITIHFAADHAACNFCPLLDTHPRNQCRMTGEYLSNDTRFTRGYWCPLNPINTLTENERNN